VGQKVRRGRMALLAALVLVAALAVAGCGSSSSSSSSSNSAAAAAAPAGSSGGVKTGQKAVLVSIQPVNDQGVMQDFVRGYNAAAKKYGYSQARVVVLDDPATYVSTLQAVAAQNNLVVTTFPPMIQAVQEVAPKFPNTHFVLLDAQTTKTFPNLQTLFFYENQSSYLAGVVAGLMTKTNKVGFLGGIKQDVIDRYLVGYYEGVKHVNPKAAVCWAYVGDLENPALGKEFALQLYGRGVDILHAATAGTEVGVYQASEQDKKLLIGADVDIRPLDPTYGLTAAGPDFSGAAQIVMQQQATGKFVGGRQQYGLASGAVRLLPYNGNLVPPKVQAAVAKAEQQIANGTIKVPTDTFVSHLHNCV
jgi:basic membrane protein A